MKPTEKQIYKCFYLMQLLSNTLCNVEMFRYDSKYKIVYILAITSRDEEIELEVNENGEIIPL
jgi:hypothetical protein